MLHHIAFFYYFWLGRIECESRHPKLKPSDKDYAREKPRIHRLEPKVMMTAPFKDIQEVFLLKGMGREDLSKWLELLQRLVMKIEEQVKQEGLSIDEKRYDVW